MSWRGNTGVREMEIELRDLEEVKSSNLTMTGYIIDVIIKFTLAVLPLSPLNLLRTRRWNYLVYILKETMAY